MKKSMVTIALLGLCGCSSLNQKVFRDIHEGDDLRQVKRTLGKPANILVSESRVDRATWFYKSGDEACGVAIDEQRVIKRSCAGLDQDGKELRASVNKP